MSPEYSELIEKDLSLRNKSHPPQAPVIFFFFFLLNFHYSHCLKISLVLDTGVLTACVLPDIIQWASVYARQSVRCWGDALSVLTELAD